MADALGPAAFGAARATTTRPTYTPSILNADSWFQDCTSQAARDGTEIRSALLNAFLAQLRTIFRAGEVLENNSDDMLLRAIRSQRANLVATASVGGTANAITLNFNPAFASLSELLGVPIRFMVEADSTAAVTIAVDGLAPAPLTFVDGASVGAGGLTNGRLIEVMHDGTRFLALAGVTAASGHTHPMADVIGLLAALDGRVAKAGDVMAGLLRLSYNFPEIRWGEAGGAWRLVKQGNAGATGSFLLQHSLDNFASSPTTVLSVNPTTGVSSFPTPLAPEAGIQASGSLGSADRVLTGGTTPQWRTLAQMGVEPLVVPATSFTATDVVWDNLTSGVYQLQILGLCPDAARLTLHPREAGADTQANHRASLFRNNNTYPQPFVDFEFSGSFRNSHLAALQPDIGTYLLPFQVLSNGRIGTANWTAPMDRSFPADLNSVDPFGFGTWQSTSVTGIALRGASGRTIRVSDRTGTAQNFVPSQSATIQHARLIKVG
jgi:hypothetical protein